MVLKRATLQMAAERELMLSFFLHFMGSPRYIPIIFHNQYSIPHTYNQLQHHTYNHKQH